jgi:predicted PurR-regulated permease PerM
MLLDVVRILGEALILFVMAFYWLTERDHFEQLVVKMIPGRHRERFVTIADRVESMLGAYVRGQTIICVTVGIFCFIVLSFLGVRSALMLAVFAALMEAIPLVGPFLGAIPAVLVALTDSPEKGLVTALAYIVIQQIEAQILVPKVMEHHVGLSPLLVLLALTAGALLGGLIGAVVAIPIAAALMLLFREFIVAPTVQARQFPVVDGGAILLDDSLDRPAEPTETPPPGPPIITESK